MKKSNKKNPRSAKNRKLAVAATIMAVPMLAAPAFAQVGVQMDTAAKGKVSASRTRAYIKFQDRYIKLDQALTIAGLDDGHTVYKNSRGEYFYIDPRSGDMKFIPNEVYMKFTEKYIKGTSGFPKHLKYEGSLKHYPMVSIVGVDARGNTIMKNQAGQLFHLDPRTGDMVFDQ